MRIPTAVGYALSASAALVMLAGCSGAAAPTLLGQAPGTGAQSVVASGSQSRQVGGATVVSQNATSNRSNGWMMHTDAQKALTYVSDQSYHADVIVFDRNAKQVGKITSGLDVPAGIFVDNHHNLWVADDGGQNVLEYARGGTAPIKTLSDPNVYPNDVTICPNGTVYAANYYGMSQIAGNIVAYAKGSITPTRTLAWPGQGIDEFVTCDANNNVFTTLFVGSAGAVVEYPHGKQSGAILLPITLNYPGGIKPDKAGNLLVVDSSAGTVTEYTEAGSPTGESMSSFYVDLAVARLSDVVLGSWNTTAVAAHFPSGGLVQTYSGFGAADGVAFDPGQKGI